MMFAQAKVDEASNQIAELEAGLEEMGDIDHLLQQKRALQDALRENKQKLMKPRVRADNILRPRMRSCPLHRRKKSR